MCAFEPGYAAVIDSLLLPAVDLPRCLVVILCPGEHAERYQQRRPRSILVGFRESKVGANRRQQQLHQLAVFQHLRRSAVVNSELLDEGFVRQLVKLPRWAAVLRGLTTRYKQMPGNTQAVQSQVPRKLKRHQRAEAMTEEGHRQIVLLRDHRRYLP